MVSCFFFILKDEKVEALTQILIVVCACVCGCVTGCRDTHTQAYRETCARTQHRLSVVFHFPVAPLRFQWIQREGRKKEAKYADEGKGQIITMNDREETQTRRGKRRGRSKGSYRAYWGALEGNSACVYANLERCPDPNPRLPHTYAHASAH